MIQTGATTFCSTLDGSGILCIKETLILIFSKRFLIKAPQSSLSQPAEATLVFVSAKTSFYILTYNKCMPHTEDKVLALKKISSLTGYSEKCQLLFKCTLCLVDVQC